MKKLLVLVAILSFSLVLVACNGDDTVELPDAIEDINDVDMYLGRDDVQYVDLRNFQDKMASGYIAGFEFIPFFDYMEHEGVLVRTDKNWEFAAEDIVDEARLKQLFDMDKTIFLMCGSGTRAGFVKAALDSLGYENVINVGGIGDYTGDMKVLGDDAFTLGHPPVGNYMPGTYFAFDDHQYQVTVVVGAHGFITGVFFDAATPVGDVLCSEDDVTAEELDAEGNVCVLDAVKVEGYAITKQQLGDAYGGAFWSGDLRWYEQANLLAAKVVAEQDLEWYVEYADQAEIDAGLPGKTWSETRDYLDQSIDGIAGVTIHTEGLYGVIADALAQAAK